MMRRVITQALCLILLALLPAFAEAYPCEPAITSLAKADTGAVVGIRAIPRLHLDINGGAAFWGCRNNDGSVSGAEYHATWQWLTVGGHLTDFSVNFEKDPAAWKAKNLNGVKCFGSAPISDSQEAALCAAVVVKFKGAGFK